jgi:short-subunit dehydrogenase
VVAAPVDICHPRSVELRGAVTVVTGASRGVGRATAVLLATHGATVVWAGRDEAALHSLAERWGGSVAVADLAEDTGAGELLRQTLAEHGRLDAVVINAGIGHAGAVTEMAPERIARLVDVNVRGALQLAAAGARAIAATGSGSGSGAIVFVSSIAGAVGVPGESVYSATKAALEAFAPLLREELRGAGISVSTVLPGAVDTDFFSTRGQPYNRRFPRPMAPERVAGVVMQVLRTGTPRHIVPRWLQLPAWLSAVSPRLFRLLARHLS